MAIILDAVKEVVLVLAFYVLIWFKNKTKSIT